MQASRTNSEGRIRVILADDHATIRAALRLLLQGAPDLAVVGEAGDGESALALVLRLRPDVVVMDNEMPGMPGIEATRFISALGLPTGVLLLTMQTEPAFLLDVLQAGGSGYLFKALAGEALPDAIRTVSRGEVVLSPAGAQLLLRAYHHYHPAAPCCPLELSSSDRKVLRLTAAGYSAKEIAETLYLSTEAVDLCRRRIVQALNLRQRGALVRYARDCGLLGGSSVSSAQREAG